MATRPRGNPFPGLRPFMQEEAHLFFGRDRQCDELVRRLAGRRLLAVVGTSGSGKSSLVRAGLLPSLQGGLMAGAGADWRVAILRPQDDPIGFLARALVASGVMAGPDMSSQAAFEVVETTLRRSNLGLIEAARLARLPQQENLLIVVDQFEELFRFADLAARRDDAPAFVKLLLAAAQLTAAPIYVILTMRSDFLGDCARFRDLPEAISECQYLVPRLTRDELHAAIVGPIGVGGGRIAPSLVQRLLNDVGDDMDQLPVLQHAMMRAWDHWQRNDPDERALDLVDLEAIGGMNEALSRHADEAFASLASDRERWITVRVFKGLTERGSDNREIRRPTTLSHLAAVTASQVGELVPIVEAFRAPGRSFLMPPSDVALTGEAVIDISHESLIRQWQRLRTWVDEESESRATYLRLLEAARLREQGRGGLWGEPDLTYARMWQERDAPNAAWGDRYAPGFANALAFLRESERERVAAVERENQRAEADRLAKERELAQATALARAERQRADEQTAARIRQRRFTWALVALLAVAATTAFFAWQQRNIAEQRRREAETQSGLALSRQLAGQSLQMSDLRVALLLAAAANRAASTSEATRSLRRALEAQPQLRVMLSGHPPHFLSGSFDNINAVAFSPDGRLIAAANAKFMTAPNGTIVFWDATTHQPAGEPLKGHSEDVTSVAFAPDGKTLASGSNDQSVILWDLVSRKPLGEPIKGAGGVLAFAPDGKLLAIAGASGAVSLWDVASRERIGEPLLGHQKAVSRVAFSPDGQLLASAAADAEVILWDVASREPSGDPLKTDRPLKAIAFHPSQRVLALATEGGGASEISFWDVDTRQALVSRLFERQTVSTVAFSPDGQTFAMASVDGNVSLWSVSSPDAVRGAAIRAFKGHQNTVLSVAFSPDLATLASAGFDDVLNLWDVATRQPIGDPLPGDALAIAPDARTLAVEQSDHAIVLWDLTTRKPTGLLQGHTGTVQSAAFSPDGKTLASASRDKTVRLWDVASRNSLATFEGHTDGVWSVAFSPDGNTVASASYDKTVMLWNVATRKALGSLTGHGEAVWSVAFSPDGRTLASASSDDTVILWDVATRAAVGKPYAAHGDDVYGVAFSPGGKILASSSSNAVAEFFLGAGAGGLSVILFDIESRKPLGTLAAPPVATQSAYSRIAFSADGAMLAAVTDNSVLLWDVASRKLIGQPFIGGGSSVVFSPDGKTLASGRTLWYLDQLPLVQRACAIANRNLTTEEWSGYVGDGVPYRVTCPELPGAKD